jgi:large subunit ribosomal protein L22
MEQRGRAITKFVRISPTKARPAAGLIRGLPVEEATLQLSLLNQKGSRLVGKTLKSAVANAEVAFDVAREKLRVQEVRVDEGPRLKRSKGRSRGSRVPVIKRTSHITVVVGTEE